MLLWTNDCFWKTLSVLSFVLWFQKASRLWSTHHLALLGTLKPALMHQIAESHFAGSCRRSHSRCLNLGLQLFVIVVVLSAVVVQSSSRRWLSRGFSAQPSFYPLLFHTYVSSPSTWLFPSSSPQSATTDLLLWTPTLIVLDFKHVRLFF